MLGNYLSSFVLIVGLANSIESQQVRPLPNPLINIRCGQLSVLRTTGLLPPFNNQPVPTTCQYRINVISGFICQMRLDLTEFDLMPPTNQANAFMQCNDEHLKVGNITLCGQNSGQHIYIPINPRNGERQLTVTITTRNQNGARPNWSIAVHQFECPLGQSRSRSLVDVPPSANNEIIRTPRTLVSDWLAPPGCLQYFPQPTGQIESFNFAGGQGPYIGDMNYAICFRRSRGNRSVKLIPTVFRLNNGNPTSDGYNEDCLDQIETPLRSEDFLAIPNAVADGPQGATRARLFCGQSLTGQIVTSTPPGPFTFTFNSDRVYAPGEEIGFRMQYEIV